MNLRDIFVRRRYLHFDEPVPFQAAVHLATDPARVASWGFMPFLHWQLTARKVRRSDGGLKEKLKIRPICYAAHKDAAIYAYYGHILGGRYEIELKRRGLQENVTAFRPSQGKCNIDFALEVFDWIRRHGECVALAFDIKSFFDRLNHAHLKTRWCQLLGVDRLPADHYAVFRSLTRYATVDRKSVFEEFGISPHNPRAGGRRRICTPAEFRERVRGKGLVGVNGDQLGIPQGSPMSAVLSNIYMLDFDAWVVDMVGQAGGLYRRYCDDILVVVPQESAARVEAFVNDRIQEARLEIQQEKTKPHHFKGPAGRLSVEEPLQYLGFLFDGRRILLRTASVARYYRKMRGGVRLAVLTKRKHDRLRQERDQAPQPLKRRKLNRLYSYIGRHNFISYALRAAHRMNERAIRRQIKPHWKRLEAEVDKASAKLLADRGQRRANEVSGFGSATPAP